MNLNNHHKVEPLR